MTQEHDNSDYSDLHDRTFRALGDPIAANTERDIANALEIQAKILEEKGEHDLAEESRREAQAARMVVDAIEGRSNPKNRP
jgi:hypothetical protein